jgi:hypothetical protein
MNHKIGKFKHIIMKILLMLLRTNEMKIEKQIRDISTFSSLY